MRTVPICATINTTHNHMPLIGFLRFSLFPTSFQKTGVWCTVYRVQTTTDYVYVDENRCDSIGVSLCMDMIRIRSHKWHDDIHSTEWSIKTCHFWESFIPRPTYNGMSSILWSLAYEILTKLENWINSFACKSKYIQETSTVNAAREGNKMRKPKKNDYLSRNS